MAAAVGGQADQAGLQRLALPATAEVTGHLPRACRRTAVPSQDKGLPEDLQEVPELPVDRLLDGTLEGALAQGTMLDTFEGPERPDAAQAEVVSTGDGRSEGRRSTEAV